VSPFLRLLVTSALVLGAPVEAQVRGVVVDSAGRPLAEAVVDLWVATVRAGRVVTTGTGRFEFPAIDGAGRLVVRRIGSQPEQRDVPPGGTELRIQVSGVMPELEPLVVDAGCSRREDRGARATWERAAAWYRELPDSLWLSSYFKMSVERVQGDEVGRPVIDSTAYGWGGYQGMMRRNIESRIDRSGYPLSDPELNSAVTDGLSPWGLQHFASSEFGRRVRFTVAGPGRIRFCPRETKASWISGEMLFADDGSFLWIWWRFGSPREIPATGGVATFVAPSTAHEFPLMPSSFLLWQERPNGTAAQRSFEFRGWWMTREKPPGWLE
jgi:hypothetical protein